MERFNRTLKTKMWKYFTHKNTYRYLEVLPDLLKGYNSTPHRGIKGRTPSSVTEYNNLSVWREAHALGRKYRVKYKFKIGEKVRISRDKGVFEKGYDHNWSEEYFIVTERLPRIPPVYRIKDLNKAYQLAISAYETWYWRKVIENPATFKQTMAQSL